MGLMSIGALYVATVASFTVSCLRHRVCCVCVAGYRDDDRLRRHGAAHVDGKDRRLVFLRICYIILRPACGKYTCTHLNTLYVVLHCYRRAFAVFKNLVLGISGNGRERGGGPRRQHVELVCQRVNNYLAYWHQNGAIIIVLSGRRPSSSLVDRLVDR